MKCYRQIPGIKWNWTQTRLRLKRRKRTAMLMGVWFDNCSRRTVWVAIPIGQDINKIDIPDLRSTAFAERRGVSVDLWILGSANSEGKAGQPEKAAHRPRFRPTAQQCSDWTFAHLTNISYVYNYYKYECICIWCINIHSYYHIISY